jgi:hypothetical protein
MPTSLYDMSVANYLQTVDAVGGFPPHRASEDLVFIEALIRGGHRVAYAPSAVVHWQTAPHAAATFRRFALYSQVNLEAGRGLADQRRRHGAWVQLQAGGEKTHQHQKHRQREDETQALHRAGATSGDVSVAVSRRAAR